MTEILFPSGEPFDKTWIFKRDQDGNLHFDANDLDRQLVKNKVIYDDYIKGGATYEGCSFRSEKLFIEENSLFSGCNFNCNQVMLFSNVVTVIKKYYFERCRFIGDVFVRDASSVSFRDCHAKSLILCDLSLPESAVKSLLGFEKLSSLEVRSADSMEEDFAPYMVYTDTYANGSIKYSFTHRVTALIDRRKLGTDFILDGLTYCGRVRSKMADDYLKYDDDIGSIMRFKEPVTNSELVLLPGYQHTYIPGGDLDVVTSSSPFFLGRKMITNVELFFMYRKTNDIFLDRQALNTFENDWGKYPYHPANIAFSSSEMFEKMLTSLGYEVIGVRSWQYALAGNSAAPFYWGSRFPDSEKYEVCFSKERKNVGSRKANAYGLYDMIGNMPEIACNYTEADPEGWVVGCNYDKGFNEGTFPERTLDNEERSKEMGFRLFKRLSC